MDEASDYSIYAREVRSEVVMEAVFGVAESPQPLDKDGISEFIAMSDRYTDAVIHLARQLDLIHEAPVGYIANPDIQSEIKQAAPDQRFVILNRYLQRYEPFTAFCSFLNKGYSTREAAQKVNALYDLGLDESKLENQFVNLGIYSDILSENGGEEVVGIDDDPLSEDYVENLFSALKSEMTARLFLEDRLGEDLVTYLDTGTFEELLAALRLFEDEPRSAIAAAGRAVEDFQRELADEYGSDDRDYESSSGIGQLAKHLQGDNLMMKRHYHGANYLGGMRNPSGGHGKDTETLERWDVTSEVALEYTLAALHYIRSQYRYVTEGRQIL